MTSSPTEAARARYATAPAWALLGIAAGGLVALSLIPAETHNFQYALTPAAIALTLGLLVGPVVAVIRSPVSLFRTEHVLIVGLFYWLVQDLWLGQAGARGVSYNAVFQSFVAMIVFGMALWVGSIGATLVAAPRLADPAHAAGRPLGPDFLFVAALFSGLAGFARVAIGCRFAPGCVIDAFYQPRFTAAWTQVDAFGYFDHIFLYLRYFGFIALPLTVALVLAEGRVTRRAWVAAIPALLCLVIMVAEGGRKDVGTIVGASLLIWAAMKQDLRLKHLVVVAVLASTLVLLMQFMLVARRVGIAAALEPQSEVESSAPIGIVDRNFRFLSAIVEIVPDRVPHNGWRGVAFAATLWVPGRLVPKEWQRRTIALPAILGMPYDPNYTWTCSALCDLWLIGGLPAIVVGGFLFGLAAAAVSRLLVAHARSPRLIFYALGTMTLFLCLRALHEVFITGFMVAAFALLLVARRVALRGPAGTAPLQVA